MSGCKIYELPQYYFDRWDVWTLCEAVGGCDQEVCTTMEEISEAWACEEAVPAGLGEDGSGNQDWSF